MVAVVESLSAGGLRGREDEQRAVLDLLARVARGDGGGVLLVEGEPGIGKSALLRAAVDEAAGQGFSLAVGAADQLGRAIPLSALRAALGEPFARFAAAEAERDEQLDEHHAAAWWIGRMSAHLAARAAAHPVLVCLDDAQWACPATLAAVRTLSRALRDRPVAWVLARSVIGPADAQDLFDVLEKDGAARLSLSPLPADEVTALLTEAFGAPPDPGLLALATEAAGHPCLLAELIGGLRDDDAVRSGGDRAAATSSTLPPRVRRVARARLDGLSQPAQHLLMTSAILDSPFRLEDAAEMMGAFPAALRPIVEEAMAAGIVTEAANGFCFRQPLLRRAVADLIPPAGRTALHRQYGHLLLGRGNLAVEAAAHLLQAARPYDQSTLADLDTAVRQTTHSAPATAARLALRALELTPQADPGALPRAVAATEALASAGRLDQAHQLARETLAKPLPPAAEIRLRCALSSVLCAQGQAADAAAEAAAALAHPGLPPELRDQATTAQLRALAELHHETAGISADTVLAAPGQHDRQAVAAALVARAVNRWDQGRIGEALDSWRDACGRAYAFAGDARPVRPLLWLAAALIELRQFDEAEELVHSASSLEHGASHFMHSATGSADAAPAAAMRSIVRARLHLAAGQLDRAESAGQHALAAAEQLGARGHAAAAARVLALTALRRGDVAAAAGRLADRWPGPAEDAVGYARVETTVIQARISAARGDAATARERVRAVGADLLSRRGLLVAAHADLPWLVRTALADGDRQLAQTLARAAEAVALDNRRQPSLAAAAAHSLGLALDDPTRLAAAVRQQPDPWSRASAAEDLGVWHARRADQGRAVQHLAEANQGYEAARAAGDTARVRRRLRQLGVRRRHWTPSPGRPESGWESLTETQHKVSELTAQGLNNRQIAAGMYLSSTTVAFHLRQIFRKLDIGSRVELTRIVLERSLSPFGLSMGPMN